MAKGQTKHPLSIVVTAVDKATSPMRRIRKVIDDVVAPAKRLRGALKLEYAASGVPKMIAGIRSLGAGIFQTLRGVAGLVTKITLAGGAAAAAAFAIVRSYAAAGDEIAKTSVRLGIGAEKLQLWRYAADRSGIGVDTFNAAMLVAVRQAAQAAAGFGPALEAFQDLGIEAVDAAGKVRSMEDLLPEIADKLSQVESAGIRNAEASRIFGEEGVRMVQMLTGGARGLAEMEERGRKLGAVMDKHGTAAGEKFTDTLTNLGVVLNSIKFIVGQALIPVMTEFFEGLTQRVLDNRDRIREFVSDFMVALPGRLETLRTKLAQLWDSLKPVLDRIATLSQWLTSSENRATALGVAAAVLGTILLGPVVAGIAAVVAALVGLSATLLATPIGWIILLVAGLVAGVVALGEHWDWLGDKIDSVVGWIVDRLTSMRDWALGVFEDIGSWISRLFGGGGKLELAVTGTGALQDDVRARAEGRRVVGPPPSAADVLAGSQSSRPSEPTEVHVKFDGVPPGVSVEQGRKGTAALNLSVGHALPEVGL